VPDGERILLKAMVQLVHDLRTPLGVAVGYLRMLRDQRLPDEEDRRRAVSQTVESLGNMARLCEEASAFAASVAGGTDNVRPMAVAEITAELTEHLTPPQALAEIDENLSGFVLARPGATARAVATLFGRLSTSGEETHSTDIIVRVGDARLRFAGGAPAERDALLQGERRPFDPWKAGPGLSLPLACLELSQVSGEVWTGATPGAAIMVTLPVETSTL
jgi:signal transduction histidine kinase